MVFAKPNLFIALSPLIWMLLKNHFKGIPTGLFALILLLLAGTWIEKNIPYTSGLEMYLVGSYIGLNCREILGKKNMALSAISCLYIIFTLVTAFGYWNIFTEVTFYISLWYACDLLCLTGVRTPWWMSITFFTYVAHDALLEGLEKCLLLLCGVKPIFALLDYVLMPLLVELLLIVAACFMRKRMSTVWRLITGGR